VTSDQAAHDDSANRTARIFAQLQEANERLILAALHAQIEREAAALHLNALQRIAELDTLTALPNRALLQDRFLQAAAFATRHGKRLAVLFLDLTDFKQINDSFGHFAGDQALRHAATTLLSAVRSADTVSRYGGDEFVVLLTDVSERSDVTVIAEKVLLALAAPLQFGQQAIRLDASIGISLFPDDGQTIDTLTALADAAMYRSKQGSTAHIAFHGDLPAAEPVDTNPSPTPQRVRRVTPATDGHTDQDLPTAEMRAANEQLVLTTLGARAAQRDLEEANRRQLDFMAVLAHELRNPLAPMRNVSALLARVQPGDPILPRLQDIIERQVVHMARMIDDLFDISRAQTGTLTVDHRRIELTALVAEVIAICQPAMDRRSQTLIATLPTVPVHVEGDAIRLTQIFTNLLSNASKHARDGGSLALVMTTNDANVVVTLTDPHATSDASGLSAMFDRSAAAAHADGSTVVVPGIGLTVITELVKAHHGSVDARALGPGNGSQLVVTLPLHGVAPTGSGAS
jgi:diguanylate cyclase (GGDEF)-like protein